MDLITPLETICRLIVRGRELEAHELSVDPDEEDASNETDDPFAGLGDDADDTVEEEIRSTLEDLADDQIAEVLALAWVGRGTYDASEWDEALDAANDDDAEGPVDQLMDMPMLSAYLESALAAFDLSCDGIGQID